MGLDSLMALEIKNRIDADLQISIPMIQLLQGPSVSDLQGLLLGKLEEAPPETEQAAPPAVLAVGAVGAEQDAAEMLAQLDELSEQGLDELLERLLAEEGLV
jgi:hypothetical protein